MEYGVEAGDWIMKQDVENRLLEILEAFRLLWV
jgi:hypothetical protein